MLTMENKSKEGRVPEGSYRNTGTSEMREYEGLRSDFRGGE